VRFVLLEALGHATIRRDVTGGQLATTLAG
jgi:hypothetical protein